MAVLIGVPFTINMIDSVLGKEHALIFPASFLSLPLVTPSSFRQVASQPAAPAAQGPERQPALPSLPPRPHRLVTSSRTSSMDAPASRPPCHAMRVCHSLTNNCRMLAIAREATAIQKAAVNGEP